MALWSASVQRVLDEEAWTEPMALTWSHTSERLGTFSVLRLFKALVYKAAALTTTRRYNMVNGNLLQKKKKQSFTH